MAGRGKEGKGLKKGGAKRHLSLAVPALICQLLANPCATPKASALPADF